MIQYPPRVAAAAAQLLAPPSEPQLRLLRCAARVFLRHGYWPVSQYVTQTMASEGFELAEITATMPVIYGRNPQPLAYGLTATPPFIEDRTPFALTVAGLSHIPESAQILHLYLTILQALEKARRGLPAQPDRVVALGIPADQLSSQLPTGSERVLPLAMSLLDKEPIAWLTRYTAPVPEAPQEPRRKGWIELRHSLATLAGASSIADYVHRMVAAVIPAQETEPFIAPSPLALAGSIDYLDVVWRNVFQQPLIVLPGAERTSRLAFDVATPEELDSRLSALADLLSRVNVKGLKLGPGADGHRLNQMMGAVRTQFPNADPVRLGSAHQILKSAVDLRNGLQHSQRTGPVFDALQVLGLTFPVIDHAGAWRTISARTIFALTTIREILQEGTLDDATP